MGKYDNGNEANSLYDGFNSRITETDYEPFHMHEDIKANDYRLIQTGIFEFAYGQPTSFPLYFKVMDDIQKRWTIKLKEKVKKIVNELSKCYNNISSEVNVDTGNGDEGCFYPYVRINIPIKENFFNDLSSTESLKNNIYFASIF